MSSVSDAQRAVRPGQHAGPAAGGSVTVISPVTGAQQQPLLTHLQPREDSAQPGLSGNTACKLSPLQVLGSASRLPAAAIAPPESHPPAPSSPRRRGAARAGGEQRQQHSGDATGSSEGKPRTLPACSKPSVTNKDKPLLDAMACNSLGGLDHN